MNSKVFSLFKHGHVQKIKVALDEDANLFHIKCECLPEMKKISNIKFVFLWLNLVKVQEKLLLQAVILLQQGKHLLAICYALEEFVRTGSSNRDYQTCTGRLQTWNRPRKTKLDSRPVYEIDSKKPRELQDPRLPALT